MSDGTRHDGTTRDGTTHDGGTDGGAPHDGAADSGATHDGGTTELPPGLPPELLMRYMDGELPPEERARVEHLLEGATEVQRDLLVYRHIHQDLSELRLRTGGGRRSVWDRVHQRLTRPVGWIFLCTGVTAWLVYLTWIYMSSATPTWEKFMSSAVVIGVILLFASVIHERYRDWISDPYRDVER